MCNQAQECAPELCPGVRTNAGLCGHLKVPLSTRTPHLPGFKPQPPAWERTAASGNERWGTDILKPNKSLLFSHKLTRSGNYLG